MGSETLPSACYILSDESMSNGCKNSYVSDTLSRICVDELKDSNRQILKVTTRFHSKQNKNLAVSQSSSDFQKQPTASKPNIFDIIRKKDF